MLFRCQLEQVVPAATPLAVVRDLLPEEPPVAAPEPAPVAMAAPVAMPAPTVLPSSPLPAPAVTAELPHERERRHNWPRRRDYGGRRKPSPHGRDWAYASGK
jgi:hypothetical protein